MAQDIICLLGRQVLESVALVLTNAAAFPTRGTPAALEPACSAGECPDKDATGRPAGDRGSPVPVDTNVCIKISTRAIRRGP